MIFLALILIAVIVMLYLYKKTLKPQNFPPGPAWHPITGSAPTVKRLAKNLGGSHKAFLNMSEIYDSKIIGLKFSNMPTVCISSKELYRDVMLQDEFQARPNDYFSSLRLFGTNKGITFTNGEHWKIQRRFFIQHLKDVGFGKQKMDAMILDEIGKIINHIDQYNAHKIKPIISTCVLSILWTLVTGKRLEYSNKRLQHLLTLINQRTQFFEMAGTWLNFFPCIRFVAPKISGYDLIIKINADMKELITTVIREHVNNWHPARNDDVIYAFLSEMREAKHESFTEEQLVMLCVNVFFGGATTTSNTLDFAFMCMILYPKVQHKVHESIDAVYKDCAWPHFKDRHLLPYVETVILEVQRCYFVTPITGPRIALTDTKLDKYNIPKGTTILINNYANNYDPKLWTIPMFFVQKNS